MRTSLALFGLALGARIAMALPFQQPGYPDASYYVTVARELASGHGFSIPYIWNFVDVGGHLPSDGILPIASNGHWMPLASIVQVPFIWLLGPTWLASVLPFWLLGAVAAPMTWWLGLDAGLGRGASLAGGLLMALPGAAAPYLSQPDNFSLYLVLAVAALWLCRHGMRGHRWAFAFGGLAVGLGMLARTDGVLLGVPFALAFVHERWRSWRGGAGDEQIGWTAALACLGLFLLVMGPWWLRDLQVFGSISPSSSNGRILWIRTYDQLFSVSDVTTPATFFGQGLGPLLASRIGGLGAAIIAIAGAPLLFFLLPFTLVGTWLRRRDPAFRPWLVYGLTFLAFSAVVFAVHLPNGMALHSGMALIPHAYLLAVVGIGGTVHWVAERRSSWHEERATRNFTAIAVAAAWLFAGLATWRLASGWQSDADVRAALMRDGPGVPATDRLMSSDPGAYWYGWGITGVITPNDPLQVVEQTARLYGIRWLALDLAHVVPSLEPVLNGSERPAWLSRPLASVPPDPGASGPDAGVPRGALFAVCLEQGDPRCGP